MTDTGTSDSSTTMQTTNGLPSTGVSPGATGNPALGSNPARAADPAPAGIPAPQVWPTLRARDARALIRYLVDVFGFEQTVVHGEGDIVAHAQLSWPLGGGVMLGSHRDDGPDGWALQPGCFGAYVVVDDVAALYERVQAAGADVFRPLATTDYGSTEFAVRDPEGNLWSFGTYRGEPRQT